MHSWKRLILLVLSAFTGLGILGLAIGIIFIDFVVDFWWHKELGYQEYFWLKLLYRYILSGGVTLFFFLIFLLNFTAASRFLGIDSEAMEWVSAREFNRRQRLTRLFQAGSLRVYVPLSLALSVAIALPFYHEWEQALLFVFGPDAGVKDFLFNQDVSFYLFSFPIYTLIQQELLNGAVVLTLTLTFIYAIEHRITAGRISHWPVGSKIHLSGMVILITLIVAWGFALERFQLLYIEENEPQFFGPGLMETDYLLPLIWLSVISLIATTFSALWFLHRRRNGWTFVTLSIVFALSIGLRHVHAIQHTFNRFIVHPNPVLSELDHMQANIDSTLRGFDLTHITNIDVTPGLPDEDVLDPELRSHLYNIPVWDPELLYDGFQQLQGIRPYYQFSDVDVDRYPVNGRIEQINLAAREVNIRKLPNEAQNWENEHLRFTHGYGAVAVPASQNGQTPMSWYLKELSMEASNGFAASNRPDIYFGEENLRYAIVPNILKVVGIPSADELSSYNYNGSGGIAINSLFRKLLFAVYFREERLFFSIAINGESRAMIHRNIIERVKNLTPFLKLDHDPYIVVTPTRNYWIIDAYTVSDWYPISKRISGRFNHEEHEETFNYIRNSVKIVIDAYDGHVDYYISDTSDPIVQGYRNAYPGMFKDISTMPPNLKSHLRYPKDFFNYQMKVYARYHQSQPELFYEQAETWDFSKVNDANVKPYYLMTSLEGYAQDRHNFMMIEPMTPIGRSNLSALAVASNFDDGTDATLPYGINRQIVIYRFNRESQVDGPAQVSALIDQDPEIARQLTLWDQRGSRVLRGRIIVLPVGKSVLYIQPVYIVSTSGTRIPELQRIILSMGNVVVMESQLETGMLELERKLKNSRPNRTQKSTPPASAQSTGSDARPH